LIYPVVVKMVGVSGVGETVTVVEAEPPPPVAVTVAVCTVVPDPVPVNVVLELLAGTVTGLGTLNAALFDVTVTLNPPVAATLVSVTVQVVVAPVTMPAGLHDSADTDGGGVTVTVVVAVPLFALAVTVAV